MAIGTNPKEFSLGDDGYGEAMGVVQVSTASPTLTYYPFGSAKVPFAIRIIDVWVLLTGNASGSDEVNVLNGTNSVLANTIDTSGGADNAIFRAVEMDDAYTDLAKGDSLSVTTVLAGAGTSRVFITFVRR